ncbi:wax ester/triacylglycerol synthase domain-containing protein [Tepidamorphus sp. 3E244]|uniref:wax ester/triacylglycerol synthase domain-containing protein n=1 Tax=Tepidamorphus sp. 3E244 TaxID=3385498 RepID=UPI0038FC4548
MRALGLTDAIFYNLGHRYITSTVVLDGRCDLARLVAEMEAAAREVPALRERFFRIWPWSFARDDAGFGIADHIVSVDCPDVRRLEDLEPVIEKVRRSIPPRSKSPWRIYVINPQGIEGEKPEQRVSAVIFHLNHALADGVRCMQVIGDLASRDVTVEPALAARIPKMTRKTFDAQPEHHRIVDQGVSLVRLPRKDLRRDRGATDVFVDAAARMLDDPDLYSHAEPLNYCIAKTQLVRRRTSRGELGNHMETVANPVRTAPVERPVRFRIPGLQTIQKLPIVKYMIATLPPPLANWMMRVWYKRFDGMVTILPGPASMQMGGCDCLGVFGTPPLSGPIPLVVLSIPLGRQHAIVVIPGKGFTGERGELLEKLNQALTTVPLTEKRASGVRAKEDAAPEPDAAGVPAA